MRLSSKPFSYITRIVPALGERLLPQGDITGVSGVRKATGGKMEFGRLYLDWS